MKAVGRLAAFVALGWTVACGTVYQIGGEDGGGGTATTGGPACADGRLPCDGVCVDPQTDPLHCGGCGRACAAGTACVDGGCTDPCDGGCDESTEVCDAGVCTCRPGLSRCGEGCLDLASDPEHCGGCGQACGGDQRCLEGACTQAACPADYTDCDGACVRTDGHPLHCGGCDKPCEDGEVCAGGTCRDAWPAPCGACPCEACGERSCCEIAGAGPACVAGSVCPPG